MEQQNDILQNIANISHELRTPLNAIINLSKFLESTSLSTTQRNYVNMINSSSITLNGIINDLLDFSRLKSGKVELNNELFNLRKVIEISVAQIEPKAVEKNLILSYSIDPNVPMDYLGDYHKIIRILNNLLSNSVKFTNKGNISIEVSLDKKASLSDINKRVLLFKVKDTGVGISDKNIKLLFQPFKQLNPEEASKGTGLGLVICKNLIELMGGHISIESSLNKGTLVKFTLELIPQNDPQSMLKFYIKHFKGKNVLIVDDNECNREVLFNITLAWEMNPFLCPSGKDALMYARSSKDIDIAFIDIRMPEMSGIELASKLKEIRPCLPLIAISSIGTSFEDPDNHFLFKTQKPIEENNLANIVLKTFDIKIENNDNKTKNRCPLKDIKFLIVEDEETNRFVLKEMLNKMGYTNIDEAENGLDAITKAKSKKYNIILMDIVIPYINGYDATREILKDSNPFIIAITASVEDNAKERCINAGCCSYLAKPVVERELETMIEVIIEKINKK